MLSFFVVDFFFFGGGIQCCKGFLEKFLGFNYRNRDKKYPILPMRISEDFRVIKCVTFNLNL